MLFSGGGNDIVGDELCIWINPYKAGMAAQDVLDMPRLDAVLAIVVAGFADLIQIRDAESPTTRLFFHTYDLALPTGKGVCNKGPWLKPSLDFRGVPTALQPEVVRLMLQRYATLITPLASPAIGIFLVDTQGTFPPLTTPAKIKEWWANELHPTRKGFHAIATRLANALRSAFPQLPPSLESPAARAPVGSSTNRLTSPLTEARPMTNTYLSRLARGIRTSALESAADGAPALDLSPARVDERMSSLESEWHEVVKSFLDDDRNAHEIVKEIARKGRTALRVVGERDESRLKTDRKIRAQLEVIVQMDGSRPSFMIRNGEVDQRTSPVGTWGDGLDASADLLGRAIACVGRIDVPGSSQGFEGTGFLVGENVIITNRHVLQAIGQQAPSKKWQLKEDVTIDFGHEFRARDSVNPRALKRVLFVGAKAIDPFSIDHGRLDLAVIELQEAKPAERLQQYLAVDESPDWPQVEQTVYIIGYPGRPAAGSENITLLEKLFKQTFGCKRLAPGLVTVSPADLPASPRDWTTGHDATTLGGNSGSAVLVLSREQIVAGLHYGGTRANPRVNWAHVMGLTLSETDSVSTRTLREVLKEHDVQFVDRIDN
jgi:hypothetical protein